MIVPHVRRGLMALLVAGSAVFVMPSQSLAAGSFSYTFTGKCCIDSRQFDTRIEADVWFDIDSMSPCDNWPGSVYGYPKVEIGLYQSDFGADTHIGSDKTITG